MSALEGLYCFISSTNASARPAAGGCSVSVITMRKIENPTDMAPITITVVPHPSVPTVFSNTASREQPIPVIDPIKYPPRRDLTLDIYELGAVKTMKAEAPIDAMIAVRSVASRIISTSRTVVVARPH